MANMFTTVTELRQTGSIHDLFVADWLFYGKAFKAGRPFIQDVLFQHPRESDANYKVRLKEAFNFPYCKNIVTIYNYFLTEKPAIRDIDKSIRDRTDWIEFNRNCDLYGSNFDVFLNESQKLSGAYGVVGVLVDHPNGSFTEDDPLARPYLSLYTPNNILDWRYERDFLTGRPKLTYLKLRENKKVYLVWTPDKWEKYQLSPDGRTIERALEGENRLGEVPFVFFPNIKSIEYPYLGVSDIDDGSYVNGAIVRTLSMGNEVMKMAGFPMLLYPEQSADKFLEDDTDAEDEIIISEETVLQFDPDAKNGKPAWLESPIEASIGSIILWCDKLTDEMYRASNLAGLRPEKEKSQTKSATYLRYEFSQTNSVLAKKADNMVEAEKLIYYFFAKWRDIETDELEEKVKVNRVDEFSVDAMQIELDNMLTSMENVMSRTFKGKMQKRVARRAYPDLTQSELDIIGDEVTKNLKEEELLEKEKKKREKLDPDLNPNYHE